MSVYNGENISHIFFAGFGSIVNTRPENLARSRLNYLASHNPM